MSDNQTIEKETENVNNEVEIDKEFEEDIKEVEVKELINNSGTQSEFNNLLSNNKFEDTVERISSNVIPNVSESSHIIEINTNTSHSDDDDTKKKSSKSLKSKDKHSHSHSHFKTNSNFDYEFLLNSTIRLIKTNEEFFYLVIFLTLWLCLINFEFFYGLYQSQVHIISDSFFNYFKTFSILITGFSILLTRVLVFNSVFLKNRIELIAALSNCAFLIIVSLYMCLQALHIITETDDGDIAAHNHDEEAATIDFFKNFFIVKVILDVVGILTFSDYLLHPSIQIKLLLWKKYRSWRNLNELDLDNLKESRSLIKQWNNHFENMNALTINLSSDLVSSILFLICFYVSKDQHFEVVYCLISIVNLIVVIILISPAFKSILKILMQGRSELYESFYNKLNQEISYFEGCLGIKDMKFWMTSQSDIKCKYFK
jgi:Co/Zn/Cd efflux system component